MDWASYREQCDRGDVLSRWLLEQTELLLDEAGEGQLAAALRRAREAEPLPRPADHRGGAQTEFVEVALALTEGRRIAATIAALAADPERRLPSGRGLGGLPEAWAEYVAWLDGTHPRSPRRDRAAGTEREN